MKVFCGALFRYLNQTGLWAHECNASPFIQYTDDLCRNARVFVFLHASFPPRRISLYKSHLKPPISPKLLFVLPAHERHVAVLQLALQVLIHGERHSLARCYTHNPRGNSLVEGVESLLPKRKLNVSGILLFTWISGTYLNMSRAIVVILLSAVSPGRPGVFWSLVLIVSIGALLNGPMAPETRPIKVVW
jgi:hypothetical protein